MASEPLVATYPIAVVQRSESPRCSVLSDYWTLTKPEINFLIGLTTAAAFCVGCSQPFARFPWALLMHTLLGTIMVASGAATLNQLIERQFDALMRRTVRRPVAAGRIEPVHAFVFGMVLSLAGSIYLALAVRPAASLLSALTLVSYLFLYTPLKRRTPLCTLVGAFPGAMPVLIGYVAAAGKLNSPAWILYAILFLWQFPHFMAIAWMYREDYDRVGYLVLPKGDARVLCVILQTILPLLALIPVSIAVFPAAHAAVFHWAQLLLGLGFLYFGLEFTLQRSRVAARRLLAASIVYLPLLFVLGAILCNPTRR
jgi:protoheme IX farnesyltransferase